MVEVIDEQDRLFPVSTGINRTTTGLGSGDKTVPRKHGD